MGNHVTLFVRLQVIEYDARVAGRSVVDFCRRLGISTSSFYRIRARAREEGTAAALTAGSRAPRNPRRRWGGDTDLSCTGWGGLCFRVGFFVGIVGVGWSFRGTKAAVGSGG